MKEKSRDMNSFYRPLLESIIYLMHFNWFDSYFIASVASDECEEQI